MPVGSVDRGAAVPTAAQVSSPAAIADAQVGISGYLDGPADQKLFVRETLPAWVGHLGSSNPFVVIAALSKLAWNAGQIEALQRHLHEAHLPHIVAAILNVAEDPQQLVSVRRAAIRAAGLLSPQLAAPRLAEILKDQHRKLSYIEPELRVAAAEVYVGENPQDIPAVMRDAIVLALHKNVHASVMVAALRALPFTDPRPSVVKEALRATFWFSNLIVASAAVEMLWRYVDVTTAKPDAVWRMVSDVGVMVSRQAVTMSRGPQQVWDLILAWLIEVQKITPNQQMLSQLRQEITQRAALQSTANTDIPSSEIPAQFRNASATELMDIWQSGRINLLDAQYLGQRLRELGPEGWQVLSERMATMSEVSHNQLRRFVDAMGTDAVFAFPHIAPHGMNDHFESPTTLGWRIGADAILKQFGK